VIILSVDIHTEKKLGLLGSVIALIGGVINRAFLHVPYLWHSISPVMLIACILLLISLRGISSKTSDSRPFNNYLISSATWVFFNIAATAVFLAGISRITNELNLGTDSVNILYIHDPIARIFIISAIFLVLVGLSISFYFEKKTWWTMYEITGIKEFDNAATWFKWGTLTTIVFIGFLFVFIARVFVIIAFNKMSGNSELRENPTSEI